MIELASFFGLLLFGLCLMLVIGIKVQRRVQAEHAVNGAKYGRTVQLLQDKHELHRFGIAQYLKRQYGDMVAFHLSFSSMGLLATTAVLLTPVLMHGGIKLLLLCFPILGILFIITSAVLAELSSLQPTSGGLFHIALRYGGRTLASCVAPLQLIGQLAMTILYSYCCIIFLTMWLGKAFPLLQQSWMQYTLMAFIILMQMLISCCKSSILKWVQVIGFWTQLSGIILLIWCAIYILYPLTYSPIFVVSYDSILQSPLLGGKTATPASIGIVIVLISKWFVGTEQAANSAEETVDPKLRTPWSIFLAGSYQLIFGFMLIFLLASVSLHVFISRGTLFFQDWLPFVLQFSHIWGHILCIVAILSCWMSGQSALSNASRTLFVLGRDRFLPFSEKLATISYSRQTPHLAVVVAGVMSLLLFTIFIWNDHHLWLEQLTIMIVLLYAASCLLTIYFTKEQITERGVWHLGSWSIICKWISVGFLLILLSIASYSLSLHLLIGLIAIVIISMIYVFYVVGQKQTTVISTDNIKMVEGKLPLH